MITTSLAILALLAAVSPLLERVRGLAPAVVAGVPFGLGCWFASRYGEIAGGGAAVESMDWVADLGVRLSFRLDGLSLVFALLICFIGSLVLLYASSYFKDNPKRGKFNAILVSFMFSMLGLVTVENLILLYVFWELTSVTSFLLIGFENERKSARWAALQALLVTGLGGLALLAGLIMLGFAAGSFEMSAVLAADLTSHALYIPMAVCLLLGALTKSAIFPFHFWLPNAMEAPSPVSALLHSATMVKAGVFLVARLHPSMSGSPVWDVPLAHLGGFTMLFAAWLAIRQSQIKRVLAYSTVSSLGMLIMLLGIGAVKAAAVYLIAHALFKGCLFLIAGSITKKTGLKDPEQMAGLASKMPVTMAVAAVAALSMAGMFPLIGFVGKELVLKAGLSHPEWAMLATVATVVAALLTVTAALIVGLRPFLGSPNEKAAKGKDPGWRQLAGPVALAGAGIVAGVAPWLFAEPLVSQMIAAISGESPKEVHLSPVEMLWPPTVATWLSILALSLGSIIFFARRLVHRITQPLGVLERFGPARFYDPAYNGVLGLGELHTRVIQNGSLQRYVRLTLLFGLACVAPAIWRSGVLDGFAADFAGLAAVDVILVAVLMLAAFASTFQRTALATVAVAGAVGLIVALLFAVYGAPDLALTQFAVETLMVIIFVLVIFHLPAYASRSSRLVRGMDWTLAGGVGLLMATLTWIASNNPAPASISAYYAEHSLSKGYGRNVVNVILVDFRAMDTLGEIFVIGVAALGVFTLLHLRSGGSPAAATPPGADETEAPSSLRPGKHAKDRRPEAVHAGEGAAP